MKVPLHHGTISAIRASILHCWTYCYRADTKTLSCQCHLFLLFSQDLCTPIGQQWYQVTEKQKKLTRVLHHQEHDQERVLVSASYSEQVDHIWMAGTRAPGRVAACGYPGHQNATRSIPSTEQDHVVRSHKKIYEAELFAVIDRSCVDCEAEYNNSSQIAGVFPHLRNPL